MASESESMGKVGRPRIQIDWKKFDDLCADQCTLREIASAFDCSEDTIERAVKRTYKVNFAEYFSLKRCRGFISLRRKQMELALSGDKTMLIWLGKQYLGQAEKQITEHAVTEETGKLIIDLTERDKNDHEHSGEEHLLPILE
jgi:hypothetical protein